MVGNLRTSLETSISQLDPSIQRTALIYGDSILGEILEYHFLRQHQTFGSDPTIISRVRSNIEQNLITWMQSLRRRVAELEPTSGPLGLNDTNYDDITQRPRLALYGEHLHHCMYVLLYGKMDFVAMYNDASWLASPDFLLAGEHAVACAKILVGRNLQLCYRYFGTYLLQSSFVFLILAKKLRR
jgi:xylanolytic transcriptional activator XlnR